MPSMDLLLVLAKTDPQAVPGGKGISAFIVEKGTPGYIITNKMDKLGYRGFILLESGFENCEVPVENLIGLDEGKGFIQVMEGLEVGRINVASRAVGVARAAFEQSVSYAQQRETFGKTDCEAPSNSANASRYVYFNPSLETFGNRGPEKKTVGNAVIWKRVWQNYLLVKVGTKVTMDALLFMVDSAIQKSFQLNDITVMHL